MKLKIKLLTLVFTFVFLKGKSQITLDNTYTTTITQNNYFNIVKLSNSGYKYVNPDFANNNITLYNLNHTIFKTLIVPTFTAGSQSFYHISETLFNTNPNDVEFIIRQNPTTPIYNVKILVVNENGTVLFSKDSADLSGAHWLGNTPVSYTPSGPKMLLYHRYSTKVFVYTLPGNLVCSDCTNGTITGIPQSGKDPQSNSTAFPNPSKDEIKIKYVLPANSSNAKISFYSIDGKELKTFTIDNHIDYMTIDKEALGGATGIYLYKIYNDAGLISSDKIIFE